MISDRVVQRMEVPQVHPRGLLDGGGCHDVYRPEHRRTSHHVHTPVCPYRVPNHGHRLSVGAPCSTPLCAAQGRRNGSCLLTLSVHFWISIGPLSLDILLFSLTMKKFFLSMRDIRAPLWVTQFMQDGVWAFLLPLCACAMIVCSCDHLTLVSK